jgi:hypothetical protein
MQLAPLIRVVANRTVALGHLLVALLTLAGVVEEPVVALAVVDVAVTLALGCRDEEDVLGLARRANASLATSSVLFVQFGSTNCFPWLEVDGDLGILSF